jgi:hypothetical protein
LAQEEIETMRRAIDAARLRLKSGRRFAFIILALFPIHHSPGFAGNQGDRRPNNEPIKERRTASS